VGDRPIPLGTESGTERKFFYVCPKCGKHVYSCPDPACEGIGHHVFGEDWEGCDDDVSLATAGKTYCND
jgi:hypothetical protein